MALILDGEVLEPVAASAPKQWTISRDTGVIALIFGPQGLNAKKIKDLVGKNREILTELADYAEQNSKVEGLVETLASAEQSGGSLDAALSGFSARYGVGIPKLDTHASTDQQASVLLGALLPAMTAYDPLSSKQAVMQQSAGLAASVAGMFFGSPVGLAAGGASLFQNLRTLMFPGVEFRSAFAPVSGDGLALCAKRQESKSRTRVAYLWAHRLPGVKPPSAAVAGEAHLPLGAKSLVRIEGANLRNLDRVREWKLDGAPAAVAVGQNALEIDLSKSKLAPGAYKLTAQWDWDALEIGRLHLHPFGNLKEAHLKSGDRLAEGHGKVPVELAGADFQFVEKVAIEPAGKRRETPVELAFTLPKGKRGGEQRTLETEIDTAARGDYRLLLAQSDGLTYEVPVRVLPPYPRIENLPLRANTGDARQTLVLRGKGLERIESLASDAGAFELGPPDGETRTAEIRLSEKPRKGERFAISMKIQGVEAPVELAGALQVAGPRPRIREARKSLAAQSGVALRAEEVPTGAAAGFALSVDHIEGTPTVEVTCANQKIAAKLDVAGEGMLFLSLDPGAVAQPGCRLTAAVATEAAGRSDPYPLGQAVRVPRIEQFTLTDEKLGENVYAGILKGQDLDTVEKAGWDGRSGLPVEAIPAPAPDNPRKQVLKIALPWPAPAPHAPVFIWLRGEAEGRATGVKY